MTTVVDIINLALTRVRYPVPVGNVYEGSKASRIALQIYSQTRDNIFGIADWPFLRQDVDLGAPIKTAPSPGYSGPWDPNVNPPLPWKFQYTYPPNCIEVRSVRPVPSLIPEYNPQPNIFITAFDTIMRTKVVLTNLLGAQAMITGRVIDPAEWQDSNFTEALVDALAVQFEKHLPDGDVNRIVLAERDSTQTTEIAQARRG